ncbi:diguanylate cyclase [Ruminococcaceae bacterium OttesenSCG-928-D13]|nr:diguanylate cyclase [Ruminococcaceae bacterium OttesenSCG-928-D13]
MDKNAELLFEYLRNVLYSPDKAELDPEKLDEGFRDLGAGLLYFGQCLIEAQAFAAAMGRGELDTPPPSPGNEIASPLKSLQASLKHITWQTEQVAKGDYKQRVDFMGRFSEAFNTMIQQLDHRQQALMDEIENGRRKTLALEQSNSLFTAIAALLPQWLIVVDPKSAEPLYMNSTAKTELVADQDFSEQLWVWLNAQAAGFDGSAQEPVEMTLPYGQLSRVLSVSTFPMRWREHSAVAFVITDVSREKRERRELENVAYRDTLTGTYSRHYGMLMLEAMLEAKKQFCICFTDLDNLKYVNDTYGHNVGDEYIISAAEIMQSSSGGTVCRLGGDEFMVLLELCKREEAEQQMETIREALLFWGPSDRPEGYEFIRSISYGVVEVGQDNTFTASELLSVADARMYNYKRTHKKHRKV